MVRKIYFLAILLVTGGLLFTSCTKEDELSSKKEVLSFVFEASKNAELEHNILGIISGTNITTTVPFGTDISNMIPTIEISPRATLDPGSGISTDFTNPVTYTVTAEDGTTQSFTATVPIEPAPYIGNWVGGPIDYGLGLVYVKVDITEDGTITVKMEDMISHENDPQSIKGIFDPMGEPMEDLCITQTHRWIGGNWTEESNERTFRYHFENAPKMRFFYCICHPRQEWWFQLDLSPQ
jgi:hypothetical protein